MNLFLSNSSTFVEAGAILGYIGAALSSVFLIPQVYKVIKTKSIKDVSMIMNSIIILGTFIWLGYAILNILGGDSTHAITMIPVVISNIAQLMCSIVLLFLKMINVAKTKEINKQEV